MMERPRGHLLVNRGLIAVLAALFVAGSGEVSRAEDAPADPAPPAYRTIYSVRDTLAESLFGKRDPSEWRPLGLSNLFTEGWNEPWLAPPRGTGGAPRQGWINATDGDFYRLAFFTYGISQVHRPNELAQLGQFTLYTPLSRRLEVVTNLPFIQKNENLGSGQVFIGSSGAGTRRLAPGQVGTGDLSFAPRVMLIDTQDFALIAQASVRTPTGRTSADGKTSLTPSVQFWSNPFGGFGFRGGLGVTTPLNHRADGPSLIGQLAAGYTFTDHDVPLFGDFTAYLSGVVKVDLPDSAATTVSLTPGIRTHVGGDWYVLAAVETPVTGSRGFDSTGFFWFMKAW